MKVLAVWFALKRSLSCKSDSIDVYDPRGSSNGSSIQKGNSCRSGSSSSISSLGTVVCGNKRHTRKLRLCSPRSIRSADLLNPAKYEVIVNDSKSEIKITGFGANLRGKAVSTSVGTLTRGTPGPGGYYISPPRKILSNNGVSSKPRRSLEAASHGSAAPVCHKCGKKFKELYAVEAHQLSRHAVTELIEGDSSRRIVEIICRASWIKSENCGWIDKILKVHNMQTTIAQFENYRELVKIKASKLPDKHPRVLADGNELLRFHGTTLACSLGMHGCSSLCRLDVCGVCKILRNGFSTRKEIDDSPGFFTASTSNRAFESIKLNKQQEALKKALIVCRVIAGKVHRSLENFQEMEGQSRFDSLAGKMVGYSNIDELYLLNPKALLPCFVVVCKP